MGDKVERGQLLATLYGNDLFKLENAAITAAAAFKIEEKNVEKPKLIKKIIGL